MTEGQCAAHEPDEERPEPETSEWHRGTTQDMDCQKAFDNTVHEPASMIASGNESAVRGNLVVRKLSESVTDYRHMLIVRVTSRSSVVITEVSARAFIITGVLSPVTIIIMWFITSCTMTIISVCKFDTVVILFHYFWVYFTYLNASHYDILFSFTLFSSLNKCFIFCLVLLYSHCI